MAKTDQEEEEMIVERVYAALIDQRLAPGTKLSEAAMCKAFGVGRMRIRRSLLLLANRELVDLLPNRGAFVARPTAKQARDVFQSRLLVEPSLAKIAVGNAKAKDIAALERHLHKETEAHKTGNRREAITLSGQFHTALAQIADNAVMLRTVKDLVARSSLIIGMFGHTGVNNCRDDEHAGLLQAFRTGDGDLAHQLMEQHINHIKDHLDLNKPKSQEQDLIGLFQTLNCEPLACSHAGRVRCVCQCRC
ncbi:GntR family transcriptional regulator [Comamonadaceae bacterium M7527]|nr:GntR family transcriptional regulator [Comamonadaceae bacterium M7527]